MRHWNARLCVGLMSLVFFACGPQPRETDTVMGACPEGLTLCDGECVDTFDDPSGAFFLARYQGIPVAMGGWRFRSDVAALGGTVAAEIKRMYVVPKAQRRGFARTVLAHLETTAAEAGADVMVLETGMQQPEAIALYESSGYIPVDGFGIYRDSPMVRYLGKRLA